jgi:hypothetical protein
MDEPYQDPRIMTVTFLVEDRPLPVQMTEKSAIDCILSALAGQPSDELSRAFDTIRSVKSYRRLIKHGAKSKNVSSVFRERFHTAWTVNGFRWREAVDDDLLLIRALRAILAPFAGESLTLFRGEQSARYETGRVGFNWTPKREVAKMFASGLCTTYNGGGVLLRAMAPAAAIIASPSAHSRYLGEDEFVVEPSLLREVTELARFQPLGKDN